MPIVPNLTERTALLRLNLGPGLHAPRLGRLTTGTGRAELGGDWDWSWRPVPSRHPASLTRESW